MREAVEKGNQELRTKLLACMLIICFETFHGDHKAALAQMQIGLGLITDDFRLPSPASKSITSGQQLEDEICEAFDGLDIQMMTFPDPRPLSQHKLMMRCHVDHIAAMPKTFSTIKIARFYSDIFMRRLSCTSAFSTLMCIVTPWRQSLVPRKRSLAYPRK